jgi:hypothetical protein
LMGAGFLLRSDLLGISTQAPRSAPHLRQDWACPAHICTGTLSASAPPLPGLGSPLPHLGSCLPHRLPGLGSPPATSAPGLGSPLHIGAGTGLTPVTSMPGLGSPPAASAPGLGSPLPCPQRQEVLRHHARRAASARRRGVHARRALAGDDEGRRGDAQPAPPRVRARAVVRVCTSRSAGACCDATRRVALCCCNAPHVVAGARLHSGWMRRRVPSHSRSFGR